MDENHECTHPIMLEHVKQLTEQKEQINAAHSRINGIVILVQDFTVEMRESNKNIADMVMAVKLLTQEIGHMALAVDANKTDIKEFKEDIEEIKDNMETKDTVLKLYNKLENSTLDYKKGMDAIMANLRETKDDLDAHKQEPALEALAREKALKRWAIGIIATIIGSQLIPYIIAYVIPFMMTQLAK